MRYNRIKKSPRTDCGRASVLYTSEGCGEAEAFLGNAKRVFPVCHVTAAQRQCRFFLGSVHVGTLNHLDAVVLFKTWVFTL